MKAEKKAAKTATKAQGKAAPELYYVIALDYNEGLPLPLEEVNRACQHIAHPVFNQYDDGTDSFLYIIARRKLSQTEMDTIYKEYCGEHSKPSLVHALAQGAEV